MLFLTFKNLDYGVHGLAATVWSNDVAHAEAVAARIDAGTGVYSLAFPRPLLNLLLQYGSTSRRPFNGTW